MESTGTEGDRIARLKVWNLLIKCVWLSFKFNFKFYIIRRFEVNSKLFFTLDRNDSLKLKSKRVICKIHKFYLNSLDRRKCIHIFWSFKISNLKEGIRSNLVLNIWKKKKKTTAKDQKCKTDTSDIEKITHPVQNSNPDLDVIKKFMLSFILYFRRILYK